MAKNRENTTQFHGDDILMSIKAEPEIVYEREDNANSTSDELEIDGSLKASPKEIIDYKFVKAIEKLGRILLNKSNTPQVKSEKHSAAAIVSKFLAIDSKVQLTVAQTLKKIANFKQKIKTKNENKIAGVKIHFKPSELLFMELVNAENSINPLSAKNDNSDGLVVEYEICDYTNGGGSSDEEKYDASYFLSETSILEPPTRKKRKRSRENNDNKDTNVLQKELLIKQLDLIRMEKEMKQEKHKQNMEMLRLEMEQKEKQHMMEMEILFLKKQVIQAKLSK